MCRTPSYYKLCNTYANDLTALIKTYNDEVFILNFDILVFRIILHCYEVDSMISTLQKLILFSICAILLFFPMTTQTRNKIFIRGKNKVTRKQTNKKKHEFSYSKNTVNFEVFHLVISANTNFTFLKSLSYMYYTTIISQ